MSPPAYFDIVFDIPGDLSFSYRIDPKGEASVGKRAVVPFGRRECTGYITASRESPPEGLKEIKDIRRVVDKEEIFDEGDMALARWVAGYYLCGFGQALSAMIPSGRRETSYSAFAGEEEIPPAALEMSAEQRQAMDAITAEHPAAAAFYLFGITGSGKTEVFLRAAEYFMKRGKGVLYLVPEISLTHQTAEAMGQRFGSAAATFHSRMSPAARFTEWMRIRRGEVRIVTGPRSAVFAPIRDLGLIIIDEEHDGSYKSENTPRYHARQVAMRRSRIEGARLVMGSATPSAEAWEIMLKPPETGPGNGSGGKPQSPRERRPDGGASPPPSILRLDLTRRLSGGSLPEIYPVSLEHSEGCLSGELKQEIRKTAGMGRQSILFLNRRGFAYFYHCRHCGFELSCKHCSVSLTWHKKLGRAVCHYCGYSEVPPRACPNCGSLEAGFTGFGTELIEEELGRTFPDLRIRRADSDTTSRKGSLEETLALFRAGAFDILLGTQMVAKGLNFPGVRLVGVILADTGLQLPDFRAAERTFSLLVQVSGRAGRYFPDGKVIVQTFRPRDPAILRACALDVDGFFKAELAQRKLLGFPPYSRLIRFTARSRDEGRAEKAINLAAHTALQSLPRGADVLGPAECPISLRSGYYRKQFFLRGPAMGALHALARKVMEVYTAQKDSRVYMEVDVDPVNLL
ncbi:MAG: primosomal protein N' [Treponema sp.]|nr:primosomal protein N' [Treponema sp.]